MKDKKILLVNIENKSIKELMSWHRKAVQAGQYEIARAIQKHLKDLNAEIREKPKRHVGNYKKALGPVGRFGKALRGLIRKQKPNPSNKRGRNNPFFKRKRK